MIEAVDLRLDGAGNGGVLVSLKAVTQPQSREGHDIQQLPFTPDDERQRDRGERCSSSSVVFGHRRRFAKATEGMARKTKAEAQV